MGEMILIDSNIIIYHFNGVEKATQFLSQNRGNMSISMMTVAEVLSFAPDTQALKLAEKFLNEQFTWLDISREIILKSAEIRREKKIKTPDAIIGATALCHGLALVSRNSKDFKHLPITLINPIDE